MIVTVGERANPFSRVGTGMDVTDAVETRLEVREYREEPVDDATKRRILDAGRLASSGSNRQHWRFLLLDDDADVERLAELSPSGSWVAGADFAVVILTDADYGPRGIDAGRALTYMQLVGWAAGIGSCLYTVDNPALREFLEIPDAFELTAVLGFGYPTFDVDAVRGEKDREPLDEIAYCGRFGGALELDG